MKCWLFLQVICMSLAIITTNKMLQRFKNVLHSTKNTANGVAKTVVGIFGHPKDILDMTKQVIAGYPCEVVVNIINKICSAMLASKSFIRGSLPDIKEIRLQLLTKCVKLSIALPDAENLWRSQCFNRTKPVVILATGWTTTINDNRAIDEFSKAFNCRGDVNFIALDVAHFVNTFYSWASFNSEELGMHLSTALQSLVKYVPLKNVHLIGHSLGAHIVGAAGRYFLYKTGNSIPRITGLDPSKPCFNEGEILSGLLRGDADFIDVIHSNPGVLGKQEPLGDIDFYPGGVSPLAKGCLTVACAHTRAWEYFVETIYPGNENNFQGFRCNSLHSLNLNKCGNISTYMGYNVDTTRKGNYFLAVNANSPFGKNINGSVICNTTQECLPC